jgi:hypothetical protein
VQLLYILHLHLLGNTYFLVCPRAAAIQGATLGARIQDTSRILIVVHGHLGVLWSVAALKWHSAHTLLTFNLHFTYTLFALFCHFTIMLLIFYPYFVHILLTAYIVLGLITLMPTS